MAERARPSVILEEYVERQTESATGRTVLRQYRRTQWNAPPSDGPSLAREMLDTSVPLLRAVAIMLAPALGQMALRALAPRVRAALPGASRPRIVDAVAVEPLALPPPSAADEREA
jgi:hypothetical protein